MNVLFAIKNMIHKQVLWKHKKKCKEETSVSSNELIEQMNKHSEEIETLKNNQNEDFQRLTKMIFTLSKHVNDKNFIGYLNENCKDSINLKDFFETIKIDVKDLLKVGESGYVHTISSLFVNGFKEISDDRRPFYYNLDSGVGQLYIRDNDQWIQDDIIFDREFKCFDDKLLSYMNDEITNQEKIKNEIDKFNIDDFIIEIAQHVQHVIISLNTKIIIPIRE